MRNRTASRLPVRFSLQCEAGGGTGKPEVLFTSVMNTPGTDVRTWMQNGQRVVEYLPAASLCSGAAGFSSSRAACLPELVPTSPARTLDFDQDNSFDSNFANRLPGVSTCPRGGQDLMTRK